MKAGVELSGRGDVLADDARQHLEQAGHRLVHVHDARLEDLVPAEGQQLRRQRHRALARLADLRELGEHRMPRGQLHGGEVAVAEDRGQQVVEVVRDPSRQAAHRLELLRLIESSIRAACGA